MSGQRSRKTRIGSSRQRVSNQKERSEADDGFHNNDSPPAVQEHMTEENTESGSKHSALSEVTGNRRKLGSSRRSKGRQVVNDSIAESTSNEALFNQSSNLLPGTTEIESASNQSRDFVDPDPSQIQFSLSENQGDETNPENKCNEDKSTESMLTEKNEYFSEESREMSENNTARQREVMLDKQTIQDEPGEIPTLASEERNQEEVSQGNERDISTDDMMEFQNPTATNFPGDGAVIQSLIPQSENLVKDGHERPDDNTPEAADFCKSAELMLEETDIFHTFQNEEVSDHVKTNDDSANEREVSNPDKLDSDLIKQSNSEVLSQIHEGDYVDDFGEQRINTIERADTAPGPVCVVESHMRVDMKVTAELTIDQEEERLPCEDNESSLQTLHSNCDLSAGEDIHISNSTGRRKMASTQRHNDNHEEVDVERIEMPIDVNAECSHQSKETSSTDTEPLTERVTPALIESPSYEQNRHNIDFPLVETHQLDAITGNKDETEMGAKYDTEAEGSMGVALQVVSENDEVGDPTKEDHHTAPEINTSGEISSSELLLAAHNTNVLSDTLAAFDTCHEEDLRKEFPESFVNVSDQTDADQSQQGILDSPSQNKDIHDISQLQSAVILITDNEEMIDNEQEEKYIKKDEVSKPEETSSVNKVDFEIVKSEDSGGTGEGDDNAQTTIQEPNNMSEEAHNITIEIQNLSEDSSPVNRRRKMGSTRRSLRPKGQEFHRKQEADNELSEIPKDVGDAAMAESETSIKTSQLQMEHKDRDSEKEKENIFEMSLLGIQENPETEMGERYDAEAEGSMGVGLQVVSENDEVEDPAKEDHTTQKINTSHEISSSELLLAAHNRNVLSHTLAAFDTCHEEDLRKEFPEPAVHVSDQSDADATDAHQSQQGILDSPSQNKDSHDISQIKSPGKRRKMGSTRSMQHGRKHEGGTGNKDETNEGSMNTEVDMRNQETLETDENISMGIQMWSNIQSHHHNEPKETDNEPEDQDITKDEVSKSEETTGLNEIDFDIMKSEESGGKGEGDDNALTTIQEPNNMNEEAHLKIEMENSSEDSSPVNRAVHQSQHGILDSTSQVKSQGKRRKMGSTRKTAGEHGGTGINDETKEGNLDTDIDNMRNEESSETELKTIIDSLQLQMEHKDGDSEEREKTFETKECSHQSVLGIEENPEHSDDLHSESKSAVKRRKMGSNRNPRDLKMKTDIGTCEKVSYDQSGKKPSSSSSISHGDPSRPVDVLSQRASEQEAPNQLPGPEVHLDQTREKSHSLDFSKQGHLRPNCYNVMMIGNTNVGKTSFMKRVQTGMFSLDISASVGIDTCKQSIRVDGETVMLQIWDTAGQERFHSITKQVFHKAQAFLLMYDITSSQSFSDVRYWLSCIQEGAVENVMIILVGNKSDSAKRQVDSHQGEVLAKEYNIDFMECSAATGEHVIQSLETVARMLCKRSGTREEVMVLHKDPQQRKQSGCC